MKPLTKKQQKLWDFYNDRSNWRPPTLKTIKRYMGVKSDAGVVEMLKRINKNLNI